MSVNKLQYALGSLKIWTIVGIVTFLTEYINPHTKFQVAKIIRTLKSISYKNLNLAKLAKVQSQ